MAAAIDTYRKVIALTGPLLPVVSFLGRLPTAMCQFGSVLLVAETSGSLATAGAVGGSLAAGQVVCGPLLGRLADRRGQRPVVLVASWLNAVAVAALVAGALAGLGTVALACLGALAGATVPLIGPLARARLVALARRGGHDDRVVNNALSLEGTLDEVSFVLGPALVGIAAVAAHPAVALGGAAALIAVFGTWFALHPTARALPPAAGAAVRPAAARAVHPQTVPDGARRRTRPSGPSGVVYALCAALALQGAMFGASQAGIAALTERLGRPEQAGLVYAAMGVMSAVVGLAMGALPARIGLRLRWRTATAAALLFSLPLLAADSLWALYAVVVVLGAAYAPHLITAFALIERAVDPARLSEAMAFASSAIVGGMALAVAFSGRLAEQHGPAGAFLVAVGAAALCLCLALFTPVRPARATYGPAETPGRAVSPAAATRSDSVPPG
ncbi:MFS transporter [Streptomyces sp. SYSU K21746]